MKVKIIEPRQGWTENYVGQEIDVIRSTDLWYLSTNGIIGTVKADQVEIIDEKNVDLSLYEFLIQKNIELIAPNDINALAPFLVSTTKEFSNKQIQTRQIDAIEIVTITADDLNVKYNLNNIITLVSIYKTASGIIEIKLTKNSLLQIIDEGEKEKIETTINTELQKLIDSNELRFGSAQDISEYKLSNFLLINNKIECELVFVENEKLYITYVTLNQNILK